MTLTTGARWVAIIVWSAGIAGAALERSAVATDRGRSARAHTQAARAYFNLEKYKEALGEYERAYLDKQDPAFFFEIAECHRLLGDFAEAQRFYKRFLQDAPAGHTNRPPAEAHMVEMAEAERQAGFESRTGLQVGSRPLPPSFPASARYLAPLPASDSIAPTPSASPLLTASSSGATAMATAPAPLLSIAPAADPSAGPPTLAGASAPPTPEGHAPFYARWWFWTLVGGVVVGGVAAGLLLASSSPSRPSCPAGVTCQ